MDISKFSFSEEVAHALISGEKPVVALESTIISHGMPYPQNVETAREVEEILRKGGCIPATIGILDGVIHIGMSDEKLEKFAKIGRACSKVSRRDVARVVGLKMNGATTVSGTMLLAHAAGIRMFVTGGIGGVHRGAESTWDVSADLTELGRTPVAVVCAGAKSILDIPKTLEFLETQGVSVYGYETEAFPGFWTPDSGSKAPATVRTPAECGQVMCAHIDDLALQNGMLFCVPIPSSLAQEAKFIEDATAQAVKESEQQHVAGKDSTPFLLARINELTKGQSLKSNIALVKNNAFIGAQIAVEDHRRRRQLPTILSHRNGSTKPRLLVVGGALMDVIARPDEAGQQGASHTSHPGLVAKSAGGVGLNLSRVLARLSGSQGPEVAFFSAVGSDSDGQSLLAQAEKDGVDVSSVHKSSSARTASYTALLDGKGELVGAVADTKVLDNLRHVAKDVLREAAYTLVDTNFSSSVIESVARTAPRVWADPVSVPKSARLASSLSRLELVKPCAEELVALLDSLKVAHPALPTVSDPSYLSVVSQLAILLIDTTGVRHVLASVGALGALLVSKRAGDSPLTLMGGQVDLQVELTQSCVVAPSGTKLVVRVESTLSSQTHEVVAFRLAVPLADSDIVDVTGCGDALLATTLWARASGSCLVAAVLSGLAASRIAIMSKGAVPEGVTNSALVPIRQQVDVLVAKASSLKAKL